MTITHPNRDKPVVQATRAIVVVLLLVSAALVLIVTIGGWNLLEGAIPVQIAYIAVYLLFAFYATRWNRGVLPISAALAVLLRSSPLVAGPGWFARDKSGFAQPTLNAELLGRADAADRARADPAGHVHDAGLLRRAGTSSSSAATLRPAATYTAAPPPPTPPEPRDRISSLRRAALCGGGGTVDAGPSKGPVRKGVWVRLPPAASTSAPLPPADELQQRLREPRAAPRGCPTAGARGPAARAPAGPRVRRSGRRRRCPIA